MVRHQVLAMPAEERAEERAEESPPNSLACPRLMAWGRAPAQFKNKRRSFCAPSCPQTKEDIANIVQQAQHPPTGPAGWEEDVYIDEAMDDVDQW